MIRLLALNYEFPPIGGGGGNAHQHLLKEFTQFSDLTVDLITVTPKSEPYQESYSENVHIHYLPIQKQDMQYWRRGEVIRYLLSQHGFLKRHLAEHSYDLCHVFFGFPTGLLAYLQRRKVPYIVSVRGSDVPGYNQRFALDYIVLRPLLSRIYSNAKAVIANSQSFGNLFDTQFPHLKAQVVPNGIDLERFHPSEKKPSSTIEIVSVARLIPRKGIGLLIEACKQLNNAEIDYRCHIIGEGPEEGRLRTKAGKLGISNHIVFHGAKTKDELSEFLPACDLFVLPSYAEGMSNAALEALACGLPLLLTDTGGTKELIADNGFVVPCGNVDKLSKALMQLCQNHEQRLVFGKNSRAHAQNYTWRRAAEMYHEMYRQVTSS